MSKEKGLLGQWDDNINAFWLGDLGSEWVAWKGSHQVNIYPIDNYPNPPQQVIQHTKRIETLEDFTDAILTGQKFDVSYSKVVDA